jgi:hypothetical protein
MFSFKLHSYHIAIIGTKLKTLQQHKESTLMCEKKIMYLKHKVHYLYHKLWEHGL